LKTRSEPRSSGQVGYKNKQCLRHVYGNEQPCFAYYPLLWEVFFIYFYGNQWDRSPFFCWAKVNQRMHLSTPP
jgi:hypothetical protein